MNKVKKCIIKKRMSGYKQSREKKDKYTYAHTPINRQTCTYIKDRTAKLTSPNKLPAHRENNYNIQLQFCTKPNGCGFYMIFIH